jgi:hypothetical protein
MGNKSLGKMTRPSASEPFRKESKIDDTPSRHSVYEGLRRRRRQPGTVTGETKTHQKLPKIPPSIYTDRGHHHHRVDTVKPKKKGRTRRLSRFFKGFDSSSRQRQTPSPSSTTSVASPSEKDTPPNEISSKEMLGTQPDDLDGDYDDESSMLSSVENMEQIGSNYQGWERLERKLEIRDEMLKRLSGGKSEAYVEMLRHHEEAARQQKRKDYGRKLTEKGSPPGSHSKRMDESVATSEPLSTDNGLLGEVRRLLLFEAYHSGQAVAIILLSSLLGIAVYDMVDVGLEEIGRLSAPYVNIHQFYALLIVFGLFVMRLTGYFWWCLQGDSYACVKFELHNRQKLGYWDARLMNYLYRSRTTLASCLNLIGVYSMYIGISYFYYMAMDLLLWDPLIAWFEQIKQEAESSLGAVSVLKEVCPESDFCNGAFQTLISNPIRRFVESRLRMTDDWNEFALAFSVVFISVAAAVYYSVVGSSLMPLLV